MTAVQQRAAVDAVRAAAFIESLEEPGALKDLRREALARLATLDLPARDEEAWRKVNLDMLELERFDLTGGSTTLETTGAANGVALLSLGEALEHPKLGASVKRALETLMEEGRNNFFTMMNLALHGRSRVFHVTAPVSEPVRMIHRIESGNALIHLTLVVADTGSELSLVEEYRGEEDETPRFWNPVTLVECGDNAKVNHLSLRYHGPGDHHFHRFVSDQHRDSTLHFSVINTGGILGKSFLEARIRDEHCTFRGIGVGAGSGREYNDMDMEVEHYASYGISSLHYKTVQKDRAHSVFNGNLVIESRLKHIDSIQINNNILLSSTARAESMPRLMTKAESVSCEHGATVGELDEEAIFFLLARGIPEMEARDLLIEGFYREIVEEMPFPAERDSIIESIRSKIVR